MAKSTMNIMKSRITMEPRLLLAKSLVWWAGSTVVLEPLDFDCNINQGIMYTHNVTNSLFNLDTMGASSVLERDFLFQSKGALLGNY